MLQQLFAQVQNYALVLLLFALLAYSLIGFSIDVPAVQAQEPHSEQTEPLAQDAIGQKPEQRVLINASISLP